MTAAGIRTQDDGPRRRLILDRPPLNVLTTVDLRHLADELERAGDDPEIRLVTLEARGETFSAGVDVADHIGAARIGTMLAALERLFDAFDKLPVVTVALVRGPALGGGCELCLATDLCLASDRASFGQPEIRLGLFAPPASVLLPRRLGERRALELLLSGEPVSAEEALRIGLANRVFPDDRFDELAAESLERLLGMSRAALTLAKQAVQLARAGPQGAAHRAVNRLYADQLMRTEDAAEGLEAFVQKRRPRWKHR